MRAEDIRKRASRLSYTSKENLLSGFFVLPLTKVNKMQFLILRTILIASVSKLLLHAIWKGSIIFNFTFFPLSSTDNFKVSNYRRY